MLKLSLYHQMETILFYDEFNIYNKPSKEEIKNFILENKKENQTGEEIGNFVVEYFILDHSEFPLINEILDELDIL